MVLSLNRACSELGQLDAKETQELALAFKTIENILKNCFKPDKINYLALMMVDNHVHFHVIPRYANEIEFAGMKYEDKDWPNPPDVLKTIKVEDDTLHSLLQFLKNKCS
jgi:diadenosine tetraphosphate (Ap4A) HIT family hydrolase